MKDIISKTIKVKGLDIHYLVAGQGMPLLLIHGYGGEAKKWLQNIAVLSGKYLVYAPDLPGCGTSQPLEGSYYIPELVEFMESFVESLGLKKFYLVGHSLGGGIALNYALKNPSRIIKLVLVSSLCLGKEIALWARVLSSLANSIGTPLLNLFKGIKWLGEKLFIPFEFVAPISQSSVSLGSCIAGFREQTLVLVDQLSELVMPTLLIWGDVDTIIPVKHAYQAAKVIPDCQVRIFDRQGHNVYRDDPIEFSQALAGFLS